MISLAVLLLALSVVNLGRLTVNAAPDTDLVFIVTGYRVQPIDPKGLPYYSDGTLMVPASVFSNVGVSVTQSKTSLIIAGFDSLLYYSTSSGSFIDGNGQPRPESRNPVYSNGRWFVSASFVSEEMGINYEYVSADPYPFIRISQEGTGSLSSQFLQSYASLAAAYASEYFASLNSTSPQSTSATSPQSTVATTVQTQPPLPKRVCLAVDPGKELTEVCSMLQSAGLPAVLTVDGTELFSNLRTAAIAGFGFCLPIGQEAQAAAAVYKAVFYTPRLVLCGEGETPASGYIALTPDMTVQSGSSYELADLSARFDRAQGDTVVLLVNGKDALENLINYLLAEQAEVLLFTDAQRY